MIDLVLNDDEREIVLNFRAMRFEYQLDLVNISKLYARYSSDLEYEQIMSKKEGIIPFT